ncbi:hypothetical protein [Empedobacter tilapiae]|uniref:hypothetical protein n=1 Tax=Empedobacter tilapiae TaxID=2491114 RepID=UPI0028D7602B|nr:hypothetical protein [Empedobacter tilapiae]
MKTILLTTKVLLSKSTFAQNNFESDMNKILNSNNPRSVLGLAEFNINAAKYSGMDLTQDCKNVKKSLALFDAEKPKNNDPNWKKVHNVALLNNECKNAQ